eukprot:9160985-Lingulodinium_polyedra.AAC.1
MPGTAPLGCPLAARGHRLRQGPGSNAPPPARSPAWAELAPSSGKCRASAANRGASAAGSPGHRWARPA